MLALWRGGSDGVSWTVAAVLQGPTFPSGIGLKFFESGGIPFDAGAFMPVDEGAPLTPAPLPSFDELRMRGRGVARWRPGMRVRDIRLPGGLVWTVRNVRGVHDLDSGVELELLEVPGRWFEAEHFTPADADVAATLTPAPLPSFDELRKRGRGAPEAPSEDTLAAQRAFGAAAGGRETFRMGLFGG